MLLPSTVDIDNGAEQCQRLFTRPLKCIPADDRTRGPTITQGTDFIKQSGRILGGTTGKHHQTAAVE